MVRKCVRTLRLRSERFTLWRARLAADFVLAMLIENLWDVHARKRIGIVNPEAFRGQITQAGTQGHLQPIQGGALQPFVQFQLRFLPLRRQCPSHSHLFD
jgi:hypothetical protein